MNEPIVHWNILPKYLELYLFKWNQDNPPVPFLRRRPGHSNQTHQTARAPWKLTELGKADLEEYRQKG